MGLTECIAESAAPTRLLSLRYTEVIYRKFSKPRLVALKYAGWTAWRSQAYMRRVA